jgi:ABC-type uncharacterized transport system ATPase subunit
MPEVLHVSDRIVAMFSGEIIATFTSEEVTEDNLIQAISGIVPEKAASNSMEGTPRGRACGRRRASFRAIPPPDCARCD